MSRSFVIDYRTGENISNENNSDFCYKAVKEALRKIQIKTKDIGLLFTSTNTPDYSLPQTLALIPELNHPLSGWFSSGINRFVLHPKYGAFILLGTILTNIKFKDYDKPLGKEVCINCFLCVQNCPARVLSKEGIDFLWCLNNSYRYFMPGFIDLVKDIVKFKTVKHFEKKWPDDEILQMWQSLTYEGYYNAGYCMAVCPAHLGEKYDRQMYEKEYCLPIDHEKERKFIVGEIDGGDLSQKILPLTCRQTVELLPLFSLNGRMQKD